MSSCRWLAESGHETCSCWMLPWRRGPRTCCYRCGAADDGGDHKLYCDVSEVVRTLHHPLLLPLCLQGPGCGWPAAAVKTSLQFDHPSVGTLVPPAAAEWTKNFADCVHFVWAYIKVRYKVKYTRGDNAVYCQAFQCCTQEGGVSNIENSSCVYSWRPCTHVLTGWTATLEFLCTLWWGCWPLDLRLALLLVFRPLSILLAVTSLLMDGLRIICLALLSASLKNLISQADIFEIRIILYVPSLATHKNVLIIPEVKTLPPLCWYIYYHIM